MITTYQTRPVFTWSINANGPQPVRMQYDLREFIVGFGERDRSPAQSHVAHGFECEVVLLTALEIHCFDAFFESIKGPLQGFWFPNPLNTFAILAAPAADEVTITDRALADTWGDHPATHLYFEHDSLPPVMAEITAVADNGNGTETITLDADVFVDVTWRARRLHYVRLTGDREPGRLIAEQRQVRQVRVWELPTEYAVVELGVLPAWLYHFWIDINGSLLHWRFTSHLNAVTSNGQSFTPKAITHDAIWRSIENRAEETTIEAKYESTNPMSLLRPLKLSRPLWVEILECDLSTPDTTTLWFYGQVETAPVKHPLQRGRCKGWLDIVGGKIPRMDFGYQCNWQVFEANTCKAAIAAFQKACTITVISGRSVTINHAGLAGLTANWFAQGWLQAGSGATYEEREILASTAASGNNVTLTLNAPLAFTAVSASATATRSCDGNFSTCLTVFNNTGNFGADASMPQRNLALRALQVDGSNTGKK